MYALAAIGIGSHAEGRSTRADGEGSHAEGTGSIAHGDSSHAEGGYTRANGARSHAEGENCIARGSASHAEGVGTVAVADGSHVEGRYNIIDEAKQYAHIIGNGYTSNGIIRSNAMTVDWSGNGEFAGTVQAKTVIVKPNIGYGSLAQMQSISNPTIGQVFYVLT
jgi:hypothetical protein